MGLDPSPLLTKFVPPGVGIKATEQVRLPIAPATNPGTLWVPVDTEGIYYKLPFNDGAKTYIIQNIVEVVAQTVHYFLDRPTGLEKYDEVVVDLRCDLSTPSNKALTRSTDKTAPITENYKEGDDGALLWFNDFNRRSGTTLRSSSGEIDVKKALNFELPLTGEQKKLRGIESNHDLRDYFKNPHFKSFINTVVYANILDFVKFTERRKGIVIARSRNFSQMKRPSGREPVPPFLNCVYEEADNYFGIISVIARHPDRPEKPCDVLAISTADDGDIFLVLLAASNRRILNDVERYPRISDIQFANSVTFRRSGVYYDINKLYRELMLSVNSCVHARRNFINPVLACFVPILLSGSDYVEKTFPGISVGSLTAAFFRHINSMTNLVTNHTANPGLVVVNPEVLARLVMRAYEEKSSNFKADMSDFEATMKAYAARSGESSLLPTANHLRVAAAQLSWSLTYYTSTSWQVKAPNPFETSPKGTPIWGYARSAAVNGDGRYTVSSSHDADVEYLLFLDKSAHPNSPPKVLSEPIPVVDNSHKLPARI